MRDDCAGSIRILSQLIDADFGCSDAENAMRLIRHTDALLPIAQINIMRGYSKMFAKISKAYGGHSPRSLKINIAVSSFVHKSIPLQ